MAFKAAIRAGALTSVGKGKGRGSIAAAESHAKREDPVAKRRSVRASPPVAWSKAEAMPSFLGSGPLDYVAAFAAHKRETGAGERKRAALAMEFKAVVSPEWLAEGGADPRDPNNPRVQQLVAEAQAWAESWAIARCSDCASSCRSASLSGSVTLSSATRSSSRNTSSGWWNSDNS